jgi:hypothetical protein
MIDPLHAPKSVITYLHRLKASCKVIRVNKVDVQGEERNPTQILARDADRAWRDKYARKYSRKPSGASGRRKRKELTA